MLSLCSVPAVGVMVHAPVGSACLIFVVDDVIVDDVDVDVVIVVVTVGCCYCCCWCC